MLSVCSPTKESEPPQVLPTGEPVYQVAPGFTSLQPRTHSNPTPRRQTAGGPVLSVFGSRTHTDVVREFRTTRFATAPPQSGKAPGGRRKGRRDTRHDRDVLFGEGEPGGEHDRDRRDNDYQFS